MRHNLTICPAYHQFQLLNSTNTWSVAPNLSPLCITYWVKRWYIINLDTIFSHRSICNCWGSLTPAGLGIFCCYFFWCQPAKLACQPLQPGSMWYNIVDEDVETAPIYRCNGKAKQPTRPCKNHDLHMEWEPTWMESWQKQQMQSLGVPVCRSLDNTSKIQGTW